MKKVKIAFIGVGNMASAIIGGVAEDGISHSDVILFDRHPVKTAPFKTQGYTVASSAVDAAEQADIIVLATQPQSFPELLSELGTAQLDGKCFGRGISRRKGYHLGISETLEYLADRRRAKLCETVRKNIFHFFFSLFRMSCRQPDRRKKHDEKRSHQPHFKVLYHMPYNFSRITY